MDLFAALVREAQPDILAVQEVRLDITLGGFLQHGQMGHLAERLPGYQYVSQPSNLYLDREARNTYPLRDEEGVAIISRFPIVHSDFVVLSRDPLDRADEHSRLCLHAVISVPDERVGLVDVYTVHMPLSERARNRTTVEVANFIQASRRGGVAWLLGDMNEEPQGASMRFWANQSDLHVQDQAHRLPARPFVDAWLEASAEPEPRSNDSAVQRGALTFPSDRPQKRIDFILLSGDGQDSVSVRDAWLIGQDPVQGTEHSDPVGMVHEDSPLWASDHRGVVADYDLMGSN